MVKRSQRLVALFAAVIILFEVAAVPQKAKAVALTASVVASVAAIMTACGVSYWAASQTDAIDYLGGKIDDYLGTLDTVPQSYEDWLGINASSQLFEVVSGGVMRFGSGVANKVLDFVRWFNAEEGVVSGGDPVGILGGSVDMIANNQVAYGGSVTPVLSSDNTLVVTFSDIRNHNLGSFYYLSLHIPGITGFTVTVLDVDPGNTTSISRGYFGSTLTSDYSSNQTGTNTYYVVGRSYSYNRADSNYLALNFATPNKVASANDSGYSWKVTLGFSLNGGSDFVTDDEVRVTPSASVSVSDDVSQNDSLDVFPSVPLTEGMSVDDASSEIFDGVTSADGLTSTGESSDSGDVVDPPSVDVSGILEFLGNILNAIFAIPSHIAALPSAVASAFESILSSIKSVLDTISENVTSAAESIIDGINAKLDNFIYEMEYGFSAVVSSIRRIGIDVRDALMTWLDDFITDVQSAIDTIKQTVIGIPQNIGQAAQDVISGIQALPSMISDALTDLFVPDEAFVETYVDSLVGLFESRVGILTYPLSLFVQFLHRFTQISDGDHIFRWGAIREPFSGRQVIAAGSYDLDDAVASGPMSGVYSTYLLVVKAIVSFWFLHLCQKKYDQIINRH